MLIAANATGGELNRSAHSACVIQSFQYFAPETANQLQAAPALKINALQLLPKRREAFAPVVLFNHGGISGINENSKRRLRELCMQGFAVFASSYRGEDGSEGQIEVAAGEVLDVLALHQWIASRAAELHVDAQRSALLGFSHGALISLQAAKRAPRRFQALIFAYGVSDIYAWVQHLIDTRQFGADPLTRSLYGTGPKDKPENYAQRHGLRDLLKLDRNLPILIVQGQRDTLVPWQQAQSLQNGLIAAGRSAELKLYPHATHAFLIRREALRGPEKREADQAWQAIYDFLQASLQAKAAL